MRSGSTRWAAPLDRNLKVSAGGVLAAGRGGRQAVEAAGEHVHAKIFAHLRGQILEHRDKRCLTLALQVMDGQIYVVGGGDGKDWLCSAEVNFHIVSASLSLD